MHLKNFTKLSREKCALLLKKYLIEGGSSYWDKKYKRCKKANKYTRLEFDKETSTCYNALIVGNENENLLGWNKKI